MNDRYIIGNAYGGDEKEISIVSKNLWYSELGNEHAMCKVNNPEKKELIFDKCQEISKLIKEIDKLNE